MAKGSYRGGSTIIHPGSNWFGYGESRVEPLPEVKKGPRKETVREEMARLQNKKGKFEVEPLPEVRKDPFKEAFREEMARLQNKQGEPEVEPRPQVKRDPFKETVREEMARLQNKQGKAEPEAVQADPNTLRKQKKARKKLEASLRKQAAIETTKELTKEEWKAVNEERLWKKINDRIDKKYAAVSEMLFKKKD